MKKEEIKGNKVYMYKLNVDFKEGYIYGQTTEYKLAGLYAKFNQNKGENHNMLIGYAIHSVIERLWVNFFLNKIEYSVMFYSNVNELTEIFNRFYGAHPDTKTDFIIHIDAKSKKYELGLYRQGLKEPVVIPECAYQLIVFKNKYEDYRSENYNQPRGAWIW